MTHWLLEKSAIEDIIDSSSSTVLLQKTQHVTHKLPIPEDCKRTSIVDGSTVESKISETDLINFFPIKIAFRVITRQCNMSLDSCVVPFQSNDS